MYDLWECDGCGFTGSESEVEEHVMANALLPDGEFKPVSEIVCWGCMAVGSPVWAKFHFEGVHPMTGVYALVADAYAKLGVEEIELSLEGNS